MSKYQKRRFSVKPTWQKIIALERIKILFGLASKEVKRNPARSHRYVELSRKIAMRYNVKMPKSLKRRFCKKCYRYLVPGINCRIRARQAQRAVIVKCIDCGNVMRYPYRREKKGL